MPESFTAEFAAGLARYGDDPCIEFEGRWYSGDDVTAYGRAIAQALREAGVTDDAPVGLVVRNRLPHAAPVVRVCRYRGVIRPSPRCRVWNAAIPNVPMLRPNPVWHCRS